MRVHILGMKSQPLERAKKLKGKERKRNSYQVALVVIVLMTEK